MNPTVRPALQQFENTRVLLVGAFDDAMHARALATRARELSRERYGPEVYLERLTALLAQIAPRPRVGAPMPAHGA